MNELHVRQSENLTLFQLGRAADTMNLEHTHTVGLVVLA